jgi:hypothetical protein
VIAGIQAPFATPIQSLLDAVFSPLSAATAGMLAFTGSNALWMIVLAMIMMIVGFALKGFSPARCLRVLRP